MSKELIDKVDYTEYKLMWYEKLLNKLKRIKEKDLDLNDYIKEVEGKIEDSSKIDRLHRQLKDMCECCGEPVPVNSVDTVNHPQHYNTGSIECIDYIQDQLTPEEFRGFCKGNVIKYITREAHKNGYEDVKKALWYLKRMEESYGRV